MPPSTILAVAALYSLGAHGVTTLNDLRSMGAIVLLIALTLNRVMVVELALPAAIPGALVSLHFAVQFLTRPWMRHHSDRFGCRRTG